MGTATISDLLALLDRLKAAHIFYTLSDPTQGAVMVEVVVPGERWEIELHEDGEIGVEQFVSAGGVSGSEALQDLFDRYSN
jgi:hypothetical protein